jgi:hypothetical protein
VTKRRSAVPKYHSISAIRDLLLIPKRFNPYLSDEQKRALHTQTTQILDECTQLEQKEIRLLKTGALQEGSDRQRIAFLSSINKDRFFVQNLRKPPTIPLKPNIDVFFRFPYRF